MEDEGAPASELAALGVQTREADDLEQEIFNNLAEELPVEDEPSTERVDGRGIDDFLHLPQSIKCGDITPFELLKESAPATNSEGQAESESSENEESDDEWAPSTSKKARLSPVQDNEEYAPSDHEESGISGDEEWEDEEKKPKRKPSSKPVKSSSKRSSSTKLDAFKDDGEDKLFEARIRRHFATEELKKVEGEAEEKVMKTIKGDLRVDERVWNKLYKYQKTGVRWLAELQEQKVGGILADEMGLGKTIQTAVFLRAVAETNEREPLTGHTGLGPSILVCPATLLQQWVRELHSWHPLCRVAVLHSCGTYKGSAGSLAAKMSRPRSSGSILITTYSTFYKYRKRLAEVQWHYVILDEGHKIRNPEARITLALKELRTPYRILLSGSPLQNSLKELWSLVDFIFPERLGSLKTFMEKFSVPITIGGYANATATQTETAYKCALVLRDAINPYFLRRMKKDVQMTLELPSKCEQVLFCDLAPVQRKLYTEYLSSRECRMIRAGRLDAFAGLTLLRKLCNHPDLVMGGPNKHGDENVDSDPSMAFGWPGRSGKAQVVRSLLQLWLRVGKRRKSRDGEDGAENEKNEEAALAGNKVLLFSQSRRMLTILEQMLLLDGHSYLRMDGGTAINKRQQLVEQFNKDPSIFVFLLTTRVGGVGVNLTGANKVVIFDPDWNPSTDAQARERAWRIGQNREVTVYRLLSTGTIEEKIYHRQIFKQFLANRVLKDPKQRRFFKTNDLHDLFTLTDSDKDGATDTGALFSGETEEMTKDNFFDANEKERKRRRKERKKKAKQGEESEEEEGEVGDERLSDEKVEELRAIAKRISRDLSQLVPVKRPKKEEGEVQDGQKGVFEHRYVVPFLRKQKRAHRSREEKREEKKANEDYVLGQLLTKSGVRSVVRHDEVVGEGRSRADERLLEREADTVARQAAAAIRSRPRFNFLQQNGFGAASNRRKSEDTPSTSSSAPAHKDKPSMFGQGRAKSAGGDLLSEIRERRAKQGADLPLPSSSRFTQLAEKIKTFLRAEIWGRAKTQKIVDRFKASNAARAGKSAVYRKLQKHNEVSGKEQLHFRSILKQIATFDGESKEWKLKDEYD